MENLPSLFQHWAQESPSLIIQLQNNERVPVAALYLNEIDFENIALCQTQHVSEKYYLHVNGVGIFFTYYQKLMKEGV